MILFGSTRATDPDTGDAEALKAFLGMRDRELRERGVIIGEGRLLAQRLASAAQLLAMFAVPSLSKEAEKLAAGRCPVIVEPEPVLAGLSGYSFHRGLIALARRPEQLPAEGLLSFMPVCAAGTGRYPRVVVLPDTRDPENLGAIARSAAALGWDALLLGASGADPWSRRTLRCSMGATLDLPVYVCETLSALEKLRTAGWILAGAALNENALHPSQLSVLAGQAPFALLLGNEYTGLGEVLCERCTHLICIPQGRSQGGILDSLNVAAAASILLWEAVRQ